MKNIPGYSETGYCYEWELDMPDGFVLSPPKHLKRDLYYRGCFIGTYLNDDKLQFIILDMMRNPPAMIVPMMLVHGQFNPEKATEPDLIKELVKTKVLTYEYVYKKFPELRTWLDNYRSTVAVYNNRVYHLTQAGWVDANGELIDNRKFKFKSSIDARIAYSTGACSIADVARFSWGAVLECVGDLCYKTVRYIHKTQEPYAHSQFTKKLQFIKAFIAESERKFDAFERGALIDELPPYPDEYVEALYDYVKDEIPYNYILTNNYKRIQVLRGKIVIDGCEWVRDFIRLRYNRIVKELKAIRPTHTSFYWNKFTQNYSPKFSAPCMNKRSEALFYKLLEKVIYGEMSGYEAHLRFVNGSKTAIQREHNRFAKYHTPYVPYFRDRHEKLDSNKHSFTSAVMYVVKSTKELMLLGLRRPEDVVTAFNYGESRYNVNIETLEVAYRGWKYGNQLKLHTPKMTQEELDEYMPDRSYQKQIIKQVNKYKQRRFLHNQRFASRPYGEDYYRSLKNLINLRKPPMNFRKKIKALGLTYIEEFKQFVATHLQIQPVAVAP